VRFQLDTSSSDNDDELSRSHSPVLRSSKLSKPNNDQTPNDSLSQAAWNACPPVIRRKFEEQSKMIKEMNS